MRAGFGSIRVGENQVDLTHQYIIHAKQSIDKNTCLFVCITVLFIKALSFHKYTYNKYLEFDFKYLQDQRLSFH